MDKIKVAKVDLLNHLKTNREKHIEEYTQAMTTWREQVLAALHDETDRVEGGQEPNITFLHKLTKPVSFEKSYDEAISMLEWETEDFVEIDQQEHQQWVMDNWGWKGQFAASTQSYNSLR